MKYNASYSKKINESNNRINEIILTAVLTDMYPKVMDLYEERIQVLNKMYTTANKLYILCSTSDNIYNDKKISDLFEKAYEEIKELEQMQIQEKLNVILYDAIDSIQVEMKDVIIEITESASKCGIYRNITQLYAQMNLFVRQSYLKLQNLAVSIFKDIQVNTVDLENELVNVINNLKLLLDEETDEVCELSDNEDILNSIDKEFENCQTKILGYKELNRLASKAGYTFDRQKGDHATFIKDGKIIVIPQGRTIGKGLSIKIQKDINGLNPSRNF